MHHAPRPAVAGATPLAEVIAVDEVAEMLLEEARDLDAPVRRREAGGAAVAVEILVVERGEGIASFRAIGATGGARRKEHPRQDGALVVAEDESDPVLPHQIHHPRGIGAAMEEIAASEDPIIRARAHLLEEEGEFLRAAVNVADDPGGHRAQGPREKAR